MNESWSLYREFPPHKTSLRLMACAVAMMAAIDSARAVNKTWIAGAGQWSTDGDWSPFGVPNPIDVAAIGPLGAAQNSVVTLDQNDSISGLLINDGMTLRTTDHTLTVNGDTFVSGLNLVGVNLFRSRLRIEDNGLDESFITDNLFVTDSGRVTLEGGAEMVVHDVFTLQDNAAVIGHGTINFTGDGGAVLVNDSRVEVDPGGMWLIQNGSGEFDLDGSIGDGQISINSQDNNGLRINGTALTDVFSGEIEIFGNSVLEMSLDEGWRADADSSIAVQGMVDGGATPPAVIAGSEATFGGEMLVTGVEGRLHVNANAVLQATLAMSIGDGDRVEFNGDTTIEGGTFVVAQGAALDFDGPTTVSGGTFTTEDSLESVNDVDFNGLTTWSGNVTINGRAQQNGHATVSGPTVINATLFDLGGATSDTEWDINSTLVVNTESIKTGPFDFFEGVINIGGAIVNKMTMNFTGEETLDQEAWSMNGEMNLAGFAGLFVNRLAGAPVIFSGEMNIANSNVEISADMYIMDEGIVNFSAAGSDLRMRGRTFIHDGATFNGEGLLHNGIDGEMRIGDGASLNQVGLFNQGELRISPYIANGGTGLASVDRFTNDDAGTLEIRIGGATPGTNLDQLIVSGGSADLAGTLELVLINTGDGLFVPEVGDEFTVLTAVGGVTGSFDSVPAFSIGGITVEWTVNYEPSSVVVELASLVGVLGDYNLNGVVDAADYSVWRDALGEEGIGLVADGDGSGRIDAADYGVWKSNFGATASGAGAANGAVAAVPEPASAWLCAMLLAPFIARRRPTGK